MIYNQYCGIDFMSFQIFTPENDFRFDFSNALPIKIGHGSWIIVHDVLFTLLWRQFIVLQKLLWYAVGLRDCGTGEDTSMYNDALEEEAARKGQNAALFYVYNYY